MAVHNEGREMKKAYAWANVLLLSRRILESLLFSIFGTIRPGLITTVTIEGLGKEGIARLGGRETKEDTICLFV
jgi:hypothetical protein